jgi:hypothetical protein
MQAGYTSHSQHPWAFNRGKRVALILMDAPATQRIRRVMIHARVFRSMMVARIDVLETRNPLCTSRTYHVVWL